MLVVIAIDSMRMANSFMVQDSFTVGAKHFCQKHIITGSVSFVHLATIDNRVPDVLFIGVGNCWYSNPIIPASCIS